ncbi:MAG: AAA family ATPase [Lachnospiraceae bacterium]|nr:AAA family ATPase [Lachnospiraceae bacterium]
MELRNLYPEFFDEKKRYLAYEGEREYWRDLFCCLDIMLSIAVLMKIHMQKGEEELRMEQLHLRGVPLYVEELLREVSRDKTGVTEEFSGEKAKTSIKTAWFHIHTRLRLTERAGEFIFCRLVQQMKFSPWEEFLFLLGFAVSYDAKYETFFSYLQGDVRFKHPTVRLAASLYELGAELPGEEMADAMQRRGKLFRYFFEVTEVTEYNAVNIMFVLCERVCACLYGRNEIDREASLLAEVWHYQQGIEPVLVRQKQVQQLCSHITQWMKNPAERGNILQLYGAAGIGKRFLIKAAVAELEVNVLFVDTEKLLSATQPEMRRLLRKLSLESILLGTLLCFYGYEPPQADKEQENNQNTPPGLGSLLDYLAQEYVLSFWLSLEKADYLLRQRLHVFYMELPMLSAEERGILWRTYALQYPVAEELDLQICANQYILTPRGVREVLRTAELARQAAGKDVIGKEELRDAVAQQSVNQLGRSAQRIRAVYTWEDLVVSDEQRRQMEMICNQMKYRNVVGEQWGFHRKTAYGRGVCAMFYGAPGTGKTMAVQVIANELGLELYRIDISQIVSKYIGETEKNISDLFRRAANVNALLFFDEADSLFAKRLEVKDSHDRNANAETAHLLQKLEDYEGIAILATNYATNIDDAFRRRIRFMVNFSFPSSEVRLQLWQTILPKETPLDEELDFAFFAENFELSGSSIKEILTNAAYLAAAEHRGLVNADLIEAVKLNYAKYGKVLGREDFGYLGQ